MNPSARVLAPHTPMFLIGSERGPVVIRERRPSRVMRAPRTPLYQLGYAGLGELGQSATSDLVAAGSGAASGAAFGPIGAGIGALVGLIGGLLAGHALRAKQARNENSATNIGVSGFDSDLRQIQQAYKSGQIDVNGANQAVQQTAMAGYWTVVTPQIQPGRNGCNAGSSCPPDTSAQGKQPCTGNIGAACCIGCYQLLPSIVGPNGVLAALAGQSGSAQGPYTADIHIVAGSKYGAQTRAAYTLDFSPPPAGSSVTGALSSMFGSSSGSSSLLPLLLMGGLLYMATR